MVKIPPAEQPKFFGEPKRKKYGKHARRAGSPPASASTQAQQAAPVMPEAPADEPVIDPMVAQAASVPEATVAPEAQAEAQSSMAMVLHGGVDITRQSTDPGSQLMAVTDSMVSPLTDADLSETEHRSTDPSQAQLPFEPATESVVDANAQSEAIMAAATDPQAEMQAEPVAPTATIEATYSPVVEPPPVSQPVVQHVEQHVHVHMPPEAFAGAGNGGNQPPEPPPSPPSPEPTPQPAPRRGKGTGRKAPPRISVKDLLEEIDRKFASLSASANVCKFQKVDSDGACLKTAQTVTELTRQLGELTALVGDLKTVTVNVTKTGTCIIDVPALEKRLEEAAGKVQKEIAAKLEALEINSEEHTRNQKALFGLLTKHNQDVRALYDALMKDVEEGKGWQNKMVEEISILGQNLGGRVEEECQKVGKSVSEVAGILQTLADNFDAYTESSEGNRNTQHELLKRELKAVTAALGKLPGNAVVDDRVTRILQLVEGHEQKFAEDADIMRGLIDLVRKIGVKVDGLSVRPPVPQSQPQPVAPQPTPSGAGEATTQVVLRIMHLFTSKERPDSVVVRWTTSKPATSIVEYGVGMADKRTSDSGLTAEHLVQLEGLKEDTVYTFRAVSKTAEGYAARSEDSTFRTTRYKMKPWKAIVGSAVMAACLFGACSYLRPDFAPPVHHHDFHMHQDKAQVEQPNMSLSKASSVTNFSLIGTAHAAVNPVPVPRADTARFATLQNPAPLSAQDMEWGDPSDPKAGETPTEKRFLEALACKESSCGTDLGKYKVKETLTVLSKAVGKVGALSAANLSAFGQWCQVEQERQRREGLSVTRCEDFKGSSRGALCEYQILLTTAEMVYKKHSEVDLNGDGQANPCGPEGRQIALRYMRELVWDEYRKTVKEIEDGGQIPNKLGEEVFARALARYSGNGEDVQSAVAYHNKLAEFMGVKPIASVKL